MKAALALFPAGHGLPTLEEVRAKLDLEEVENARRGLNLIKKYHTESTEVCGTRMLADLIILNERPPLTSSCVVMPLQALIKEVGAWVRARFQSDDGGKKFRCVLIRGLKVT